MSCHDAHPHDHQLCSTCPVQTQRQPALCLCRICNSSQLQDRSITPCSRITVCHRLNGSRPVGVVSVLTEVACEARGFGACPSQIVQQHPSATPDVTVPITKNEHGLPRCCRSKVQTLHLFSAMQHRRRWMAVQISSLVIFFYRVSFVVRLQGGHRVQFNCMCSQEVHQPCPSNTTHLQVIERAATHARCDCLTQCSPTFIPSHGESHKLGTALETGRGAGVRFGLCCCQPELTFRCISRSLSFSRRWSRQQ